MILAVLLSIHLVLLIIQVTNLAYLRRAATPATPRRKFVSVIVPARNEAMNLRRLIPSVLSQDYPQFEFIIYDDASDDGTWDTIQAYGADERLRAIRGQGPPPGWVGKVYALSQAAREARGEVFLFLDADAELRNSRALSRLASRFDDLGADRALTGFPRLLGGGRLLVSLVPFTILTMLPWPLVELIRSRHLAALNGQCWMIYAETYHHLQPHDNAASEVLEDVEIGRFLKSHGIVPSLVDVQSEVAVYMYTSWGDAWLGFRKNAYLLMGGTPLAFLLSVAFYAGTFVIAPLFYPSLLASLYLLKLVSDRASGMPLWISLLAPLSFAAGVALQIDSAVSHWTGRVQWKGRNVGPGS